MEAYHEYERDRVYIGVQSAVANHQQGVNGKVAGNLAAFSQIHDAIIILHGPKGCAFHYRYFARRRYLPYYNLESSDLSEADVVSGGEEKLRALALNLIKTRKPGCLILIPTVTSDVMQCDLPGLAAQLKAETGCPVIAVESEAFSHIDKVVMRRGRKDNLRSWGQSSAPAAADYRGCGFSEAMMTLAEQLMEPQTVIPGTINVEGYAWGYGGRVLLEGMQSMLEPMHLKILNCLPNCAAEAIVRAPAAQMNIARRKRWAMAMQTRFGTDYMHIHGFARYTGLDGMLLFYEELAEKMDLNVSVRALFAPRMNRARARLQACTEAYRGKRVLLMPRIFTQLPNLIVDVVKGAGIPVACVVARIEKRRMALNDMDSEMIESTLNNIRRAMDMAGIDSELIVNPDAQQLRELLSGVDLVIGDEFTQILCGDKPVLSDDLMITAMDPENLCRHAETLAAGLGKYPSGSRLMLNRIAFEPELYPHTAGEPTSSARDLYQELWQNRGRNG